MKSTFRSFSSKVTKQIPHESCYLLLYSVTIFLYLHGHILFSSNSLCSIQASAAVSHEPPKKIPGSHGRYAGAMFSAASKAGMLEKVEAELLSITNVISKVRLAKFRIKSK